MEIEDTETTELDTSIDIVEGTILQEQIFTETIEISHDINITIDNNKDPLAVSLEIEEEYGLRPCFIDVEKCDKIWETMKLIRELQEPPQDFNDYSSNMDNEELNDEESNSSSQANPILPYIKYQPVLGNGNTAVPNFQFSVKSTRALYQCNTCGRQYSHRSTLREHSERIHNIIIPFMRKPKVKNETVKELKSQMNESFDQNDDESNHESGSTISSSPSEDKERLLDSSSETQEIETLPPMSGSKKIQVVCEHCNKLLSDKYYLKVHEALVHGVIGNFQAGTGPLILQKKFAAMSKTRHRCSECTKEFYSLDKLREHIQIIHVPHDEIPEEEIPKPVMRKQVAVKKTAKSSVKTAAALCSQVPASEPPEAPAALKNGKTIVSRRRIKQKAATRTCEACGKIYKNHTNWKIHLIKHHGIVPAHCSRPRNQKFNKQHTLGLYTCKYCGKGFNWANTLRNHTILQHLKDQVCGVKSGKIDKSSHNRTKTIVNNKNEVQRRLPKLVKIEEELLTQGQSSYKCSKCPKIYGSRRTLKYHLAKAHGMIFQQLRSISNRGGSNFHCKICKQGFQMERNMNSHILIFHGVNHLDDAAFANSVMRGRASAQNMNKVVSKNPPPLVPIRSLRDKERVNYDEDKLLNEKSIYKNQEASNDSSKVATSSQIIEQTEAEPIIQCILCNRHCKKIRRHFIDFHKVRNPDILISQCQLSPLNAPKEEEIKPPVKQIKREPISGLLYRRRRGGADSMRKKKAMTVPGPQMLFELVVRPFGGRKRRVYACKLCDFTSYSYDGSRKHSRTQHFGAEVPPPSSSSSSEPQGNGNNEIKMEPTAPVIQRRRSESMVTMRKRRRESWDEREIQKRRLSSAFGGELRMTRAVKRLREELEHKCDICERMFRNADILASHKVSCRARMTVDAGIESNDTRESSDRDSGIGISITIKKKNDSYEIVSRDSSGERPSKRSATGDGYSDASSSDTRNSLSYSNDHRIIKIRKNYDDDVEIDLEQNLNDQDDDYDIVDAVDDPPPGQVLSLTDMCKRALGYTRRIPKVKQMKEKQGVLCKICNEYWPSVRSRNTHCWKAHKVSGIEHPIKIGTLRDICVKVLVANGDAEAGKKVWYPCHICNTVWPSAKSRSGHKSGHKHYEALNKIDESLDKVNG